MEYIKHLKCMAGMLYMDEVLYTGMFKNVGIESILTFSSQKSYDTP